MLCLKDNFIGKNDVMTETLVREPAVPGVLQFTVRTGEMPVTQVSDGGGP